MSVPTAITIGSFDGVHLGHSALVRAAKEAMATRVVALTLDPHPASILRPEGAPQRMSTFEQRKEWLLRAGATEVQRLEVTRDFLNQSPREFVAAVVRQFSAKAIVEGPDFRFGHHRAGSIQTLREMEKVFGYRTIVIEPVETDLCDQSVVRVRSSMARWLISHGRVNDAARLLGRPHELRGAVVPGNRRGRELGVPTANIDRGELMLPADGIYAGRGQLPDGRCFRAAISVGTKPTFGEHPRVCEAHLIGYDGPIGEYGWPLRLEFHSWLRDQLTYSSVEELKQQIGRDIERASNGAIWNHGNELRSDQPAKSRGSQRKASISAP